VSCCNNETGCIKGILGRVSGILGIFVSNPCVPILCRPDISLAWVSNSSRCRPLKFDVAEGEAYLLVTADVEAASRSSVSVGLQPQDETPGTASVLEDAIEVVNVPILQVEVTPSSPPNVLTLSRRIL
jgi:hypothetical protein